MVASAAYAYADPVDVTARLARMRRLARLMDFAIRHPRHPLPLRR